MPFCVNKGSLAKPDKCIMALARLAMAGRTATLRNGIWKTIGNDVVRMWFRMSGCGAEMRIRRLSIFRKPIAGAQRH